MAVDGGHIDWESVAVDGWLEMNITPTSGRAVSKAAERYCPSSLVLYFVGYQAYKYVRSM